MKIYINGRFLTQRVTGVQRYAREMVRALDEIIDREDNAEHEWCILAPRNTKYDMNLKKIAFQTCGILHGHLWEQLELPYYTRNEFLINLCNCAPLIKKKQLLVIHDAAIAAYPNAYSWKFRTWYRMMHMICGRRTEKIVTDSQFSKNELHKYFGISKTKMAVIYAGIEHVNRIQVDDTIIDELQLRNEKFVFAVSSKNPTKNFSLVLRAAKLLPNIKFVIAGGSNSAVFVDEKDDKMANVTYTGYISDERLISLYRYAAVFVYPSLYEGFGIPPLEALSQGCPIIVSNCASLPEVCGVDAMYCKTNDEKSLAEIIMAVLNNAKYRKNTTGKIKYSWNASAKKMINYLFD